MNRFEDMPQPELGLLKEYIAAGEYYLLVGSGVSLDTTSDGRLMRSANALRSDLNKLVDISETSSLQQAYSLLSDFEIEQELTVHYTCSEPGITTSLLSGRPWRRIYTFNIDNCIEQSVRKTLGDAQIPVDSALQIHHFADDYSDIHPETKVSVVHLHGFVETPDRGYVFSREEYAKIMSRPNSWMLTLTQLLKSEPFIVAGTSLDEVDVAYYLEQRNARENRSDVAPSILIEPYPSRLTKRLCEQHGFWLYEGTAKEFMDDLDTLAGTAAITQASPIADRVLKDLEPVHQLQFTATFERVPKHIAAEQASARFLLGAPLTWGMLAADIDVPRWFTSSLRSRIIKAVAEKQARVFLLLEEAGSGKTSLLQRLAADLSRTNNQVFWYLGRNYLDEDVCADVFDNIEEKVFLFVDDFADSQSFIERLLGSTNKSDIIVIGAERSYRLPYIESGLADEDVILANVDLGLAHGEAQRLIESHEKAGISSISPPESNRRRYMQDLVGNPISVAACRIQNNYRPFDKIVDELIKDANKSHVKAYGTAAIARFCYAGGIRHQILAAAAGVKDVSELMHPASPLPLVYNNQRMVVPRRSVVADRTITRLIAKDKKNAVRMFTELAIALAPYVNRKQIRLRSPEARLAGRLLDFDQVVKRLIDDEAENFYDYIRDYWSWNSRYWEQLSLLKLDRYLTDLSDEKLMQEAVQHARHAYAIERHPLSLTTLAKVLFTAMLTGSRNIEELFNEAWELIKTSIDVESKWDNLRATAFIVCFNGVIKYVEKGGILSGEQASALRDMIAITYARKLKDNRLKELREEVSSIVGRLNTV